MVTTKVRRPDASRYGVVVADADGRITDCSCKPRRPASRAVTTEVFAFDPVRTLDELERVMDELGNDDESGIWEPPAAAPRRRGRGPSARVQRVLAGRRHRRRVLAGPPGPAGLPPPLRARRPAVATADRRGDLRLPGCAGARPSRSRCSAASRTSPARSSGACCRTAWWWRPRRWCGSGSCCRGRRPRRRRRRAVGRGLRRHRLPGLRDRRSRGVSPSWVGVRACQGDAGRAAWGLSGRRVVLTGGDHHDRPVDRTSRC